MLYSPLPSPPGTFKPPLRLPVVLDGAGVLLVAEGPPLRLLFYAAGGWTELPTPPDGFAGAVLTAVVARSASEVVLFTDTGATRFDGKSWQALALGPGASGVTPGPWDDSGLRLVFARGQNLTTVRYDVRTGQPLEAELALPNPDLRLPMGRALNGSSGDFQFLTTGFRLPTRVYRFHQGRFEPGALAGTGVLLDTPGSPIAVMLRGDGSIDRLTFGPFVTLQGGVVLAETTAVPTQLTCTCDRSVSLACGCDPRKVVTEARPSPAADALGVVFFDDADGRRRLFFRRIPLPFTRSPFEESAP